jgi:hypothetical protein
MNNKSIPLFFIKFEKENGEYEFYYQTVNFSFKSIQFTFDEIDKRLRG